MRRILIWILALILTGCSNATQTETAGSLNTGGNVKLPLIDLSGEVKFYKYNDNGIKISYFAVLGSDGKSRTAFDACDVCGGHKGYVQKGTDIQCRNCGRAFNINGLGSKNKGYGCWPSYLPHSVKGNDVIIKISDIKNSRHRFT